MERIPVTVLTGYLGAGKTTLLNRVLAEPHRRRYAVIVNEFGEIGIDGSLIIGADEEIFETNNGCICCTVRGDLIRIVEGLLKRRKSFDGILIETTGLADPGPVIQTFYVDDEIASRTRLDSIITVVDGYHLAAHLGDNHQAQEQVAFADLVLINKSDLVAEPALLALEQRLRGINRFATFRRTVRCDIPVGEAFDRRAFDLDRILGDDPGFLDTADDHDHEPHHEAEIETLSISHGGAIDLGRFDPWLRAFANERGPDLLRYKAVLAAAPEGRKVVVQGVHMLIEQGEPRDWRDGEDRTSRMVFIGRRLDRDRLRAGFAACAA